MKKHKPNSNHPWRTFQSLAKKPSKAHPNPKLEQEVNDNEHKEVTNPSND